MRKTKLFFNMIVILTLVLTALGNSTMVAEAGNKNDEPKADPRLLQMAEENPDATFMVIVQREVKNKNVQEDDPEEEVEKGGGKVKKQFKMVESFSAELTGKQILNLAKKKRCAGYRRMRPWFRRRSNPLISPRLVWLVQQSRIGTLILIIWLTQPEGPDGVFGYKAGNAKGTFSGFNLEVLPDFAITKRKPYCTHM